MTALSRTRNSAVAALIALTLSASVALAGCSRAEDPADASASAGGVLEVDPDSKLGLPKLIGLEPIIQPETVVLDEDTTPDSITVNNLDACTPGALERVPCEYTMTFAKEPQGIDVGSVLASDVTPVLPSGLLVKVTSVSGKTVEATEATLADALEQGEFLMEQEFDASDIAQITLADGVSATGTTALASGSIGSLGAGVPKPISPLSTRVLDDTMGELLPMGDGNGLAFGFAIEHAELTEGVYADGKVGFDIGCGAYGGLTWKKVWGVPVYPNGAHFEASCGVTQDATITVTSTKAATIEESVDIATMALDPITFFVGPVPIVLVPVISVTASASGTVKADMTFGASEHFGAKAGIKYHGGFSLIKDFSFDFDSTATNVDSRISAKAGVGLGQALLLYGVAGPKLNEEIYAELTAKPQGERPIWCMEGGIKATVSIGIDLGITYLGWGPGELFSDSMELGCAANIPPTISILGAATGLVIFPTSTFQAPTVTAIVSDAEETGLGVTWTEGSTVLGTSSSGAAFSLSMLSLGMHTITATTTDSDGGTASANITVEARDSAPTMSISIQNASGEWVDASTASGTTGGQVILKVTTDSPLGFVVGDCLATTWSGGLPVTSAGGCDHAVSLTTAGTYTLTVTATDPDGKKVTDTIKVTVTAPAPGSPPSFTQIAGTNISANPNFALCDGCLIDWGQQAKLQVNYTNSAQSGKTNVRYVWEMKTSTLTTTGSWTTLTGTDSNPTTGSSRTFTAPTQYKNYYLYTFRVTVYDNVTNAQYYQDTFTLTYQGPPA